MKTSIATVSISGELPEKLEAIAKAGFSGVEIFENDFLAFDGSPKDVGRMVRDYGLEITLFQPFRDFEGMPEPYRQRVFDRAERKFDVMQELGTDLVLICSSLSPVALGGIDRAADDFRELGERAAKRGLKVGYEALAWGRHINDHENVGLILDSFHTLSRNIDIKSIVSIPKDKIFFVQLADAPKIDMDLLYWSRHFRNMPGEGDLDVTGFVSAIAQTGYDGYWSLEIFNDQFRGGSAKTIAQDGYRSLIWLGDKVRRLPQSSSFNVPQMPERAKVEGVAFVEFSTGEEDAAELVALLKTMGFRKTGQHRSKQVTRYQQGDVNILVNTDEDGFASAAYAVHGTSAYAMALMVEDAQAAYQRAIALGADAFAQEVADGELSIPAIRGVGGGLVYLVDQKSDLSKLWDVDFIAASDDETRDAVGLRRVDHIAQTVSYDEMLTWILFYNSIFETQKTASVDIIDPAGVVRSQVVYNQSGSLRITLNGAENRKTLAGHFIAEKFGSGIQHIAFETDDIFETVASMKANGFQTLPISPNYYGDLESRFGLDPDLTDRLRNDNILYDRDEDGEYYQVYSKTYSEGFFFEVVQRKGYQAYGAANAIFRIAGLKKLMRPEGMPQT
jgi:4-hydroxyphenylpyruvate dioxygenase